MNFNWQQFCTERKIPFVTRGPNTAKGNISIRCPFCGASDESEHMGLSLDPRKPSWGCWRNRKHRGKSPVGLVAALLRIPYKAAESVVKNQGDNPDAYEAAIAGLLPKPDTETLERSSPESLLVPKEFYRFQRRLAPELQNRFVEYLRDERGFGEDWYRVAWMYDLRWAVTGDYKGRIIVPVYQGMDLVTWTARSVYKTADLRYRTLERDKEVRDIKECLLLPPGFLHLPRKVLFICEGPFDAIKVQAFCGAGNTATCLFGLSLENSQVEVLKRLVSRYQRIVVLLDAEGTASQGIIMVDQIAELLRREVKLGRLPDGVKDPGELTAEQVRNLVQTCGGTT